jgi:hypothetical protein
MIGWAIHWDTQHPNPALVQRDPLVDRGGKPYRIALRGKDGKVLLDKNGKVRTKTVETPSLPALPVDHMNMGNLEGKELRFGTSAGPTFAAVTTAATCGSTNCAHDSLNPLGFAKTAPAGGGSLAAWSLCFTVSSRHCRPVTSVACTRSTAVSSSCFRCCGAGAWTATGRIEPT